MHWSHLAHVAHHADKEGNSRAAGVVWIVIGFFLTPALVGVPIVAFGVYKLCKGEDKTS